MVSLSLALAAVVAGGGAGCGSSGDQANPDLPDVVIRALAQFLDVGQRYELDGTETTDPDGDAEDIEFLWRLVAGGVDTEFDDHCREDFDEICQTNDDDHCSNDTERFCNTDDDCLNFGTCQINSGTTSSQCTEGICGIGEGDQQSKATFVANVAGPFSVRLTAIGNKANGTRTMILDTFPSLFVVGSLLEFGGTGGAEVGEVADAAEFAAGAIQGASNPADGSLVVLDGDLGALRVFDLRTGEILGSFGETDTTVVDPTAIVFHPDNGRLYVGQADGQVKIFHGTTGLLIKSFGNVGAAPHAMQFDPDSGDLLVVDGTAGSGVRAFGSNGAAKGVLGDTATAIDTPVDLALIGDPPDAILVADAAGAVVRCDLDGEDCGAFSDDLDDMLAAGSPSAIAYNPSAGHTDADVLVADPIAERVIACDEDGNDCDTFGDTEGLESVYADVFFSPPTPPTTTTTVTSTTTTTLR